MTPLAPSLRQLGVLILREPLLAAVALLAFAFAAAAAAVIVLRGPEVGVEGDLMKALSFDVAIGLYLLTLAVLLPLARLSRRGHRWWIGVAAVSFIYGLATENIQIHRGIDPRFSEVGSGLDSLASALFALSTMVIIALFLVLAVRFFRHAEDERARVLLLGARYASVATMVAFGAGIAMIVVQGSVYGEAGNLLPLHALGFHALQALPLVAWLAVSASSHSLVDSKPVHLAAAAWLIACAAVAWQAILGERPDAGSFPNLVAILALLTWGLIVLRLAARIWFRPPLSKPEPEP